MRYGVLVDLAQRVWAGQPIDLHMGCLNAIWQADANAAALSAFAHVAVPPLVLNVAGPETLSVRRVAKQFGWHFGKPVSFQEPRACRRPSQQCAAVASPVRLSARRPRADDRLDR